MTNNERSLAVALRELSCAAICLWISLGLARDEDYEETAAFSKPVSVLFNGSSATVSNAVGSGVTCAQSGAVLVFSNSVKRVVFTLSGTTPAGSVKFYSDNPFKLVLDGVSIVSPDGPAVNIQSKKSCYVVLPENSVSALTDATTYSSQYDATNGLEDAKGVLFSEGQLIFSGTGALAVNGVCAEKHGICSDDYVRILDGEITVSMSKKKSDGVHVKDRFRMDGGRMSIALAQKGDGVDADDDGEIALNGGEIAVRMAAADSRGIKSGTNAFVVAGGAVNVSSSASGCNGLSGGGALTIRGGLISIAMTNIDCNAIKSDQSVLVEGGAVAVELRGAQSKGIKSDGTATFNGGTVYMSLLGDTALAVETNASSYVYLDPAYCCGVKASNVVVNAGAFSMLAGGRAARGFSADSDLTVNGGTFAIAATGGPTAAFTNESRAIDVAVAACLKANRILSVNGGSFAFTVSGAAGKGLSAGTLMLNGGTFDMDLSGAPFFLNYSNYLGPVYCAGIKCDGSAVVSNGSVFIRHTGVAGRGLSIDTNLVVAGGCFGITVTGTNTAVYTCGVAVVNGKVTNYLDVGSASAIKVDGSCVVGGGSFDLFATGCCGKGFNVGGGLTIGTNTIAATPSITARTTGTKFLISSSSSSSGGGTGGPGGGGAPPDDSSEYSNPKAIKASGKIYINSGAIVASTVNDGGEGIESKDTIVVNGGSIESTCYDDCMNASSNITFNGGQVFCSSVNNDGIDSNGTFLFNGGVIASFGNTAPEEGIDCDQNTFTLNGGTFIGCGGATSYPTTGTQYAMVYTGAVPSNSVVRVTNTSGTSVFAFRMPRTYSGSVYLLCSSSGFLSSGTYTVYTNATMTGTSFHGLYTNSVSSASGGTSRGSDASLTSNYYSVP